MADLAEWVYMYRNVLEKKNRGCSAYCTGGGVLLEMGKRGMCRALVSPCRTNECREMKGGASSQ